MSAWTVIAHTEVGSGGTSAITFSSIAGTYTDLVVVHSLRSNRTTDEIDWCLVSFNSNTSNYGARILSGNGSVAESYSAYPRVFGIATTTIATANTFGNSAIYVPNYAGSTHKSWSSDQVTENNSANSFQDIVAGLWSNTAAITSISITPREGTLFLQYSSATLYGITKGSSGGVSVS